MRHRYSRNGYNSPQRGRRKCQQHPDKKRAVSGSDSAVLRIKELESVLNSLTEDEKNTLTDACKIYTIKNKPVRIVDGEVFNIKITYTYDLKVANALLGVVNNDK